MKTKTYVVTGATSGIGKALIDRLPKDSIIFAAYRSKDKTGVLSEFSENIYPFYVDYAKPETIKSAADFILSKSSKIDTLVNIAGCVVAGPIERISINEIRRQFDVNVFGHLEMAQRLSGFLENGKIINVSSMASIGIFPFISPYWASKRCLDMFFIFFLIVKIANIKIISLKPGVLAPPLLGKSVDESFNYHNNCSGYEKEMELIIANAKKNETGGLSVSKVVDTILKADSAKNPKLSYTVGKDAFFASLISKLPQNTVNSLIKLGLKAKMRRVK